MITMQVLLYNSRTRGTRLIEVWISCSKSTALARAKRRTQVFGVSLKAGKESASLRGLVKAAEFHGPVLAANSVTGSYLTFLCCQDLK